MDVQCRSLFYFIGILIFLHYYSIVSCHPETAMLRIEGKKKCYIEFDCKNMKPKARRSKGDTGEKGELGQPGLPGEMGNKGEKGMKGYKGAVTLGEKGEKGIKGEPGAVGSKGTKGDHGFFGQDGDKGDRGDRGPKGKTIGEGERGIDGDEGDRGFWGLPGLNGDPGDEGYPGRQGSKGMDQSNCFLRKYDDSTYSETLCDSDKPSGIYTIGPDGNTFQAHCIHNTSTLEMCIRGNKTTDFFKHKSYPLWISECNIDLRNIYQLTSLQINWLQRRSEWVRQQLLFKYHCDNLVPYSDLYVNLVNSISLLSWDEKIIGLIHTSTMPFTYDTPKSTEECPSSGQGSIVLKIEDTNTKRLPVTDVRINNIPDFNQKMSLEHVELCFGFRI